ncbi:MAG: RNA polymerase subunit sigma-70 [Paludibacter sp.]|nr:MAG: RNA polymerase subunit sigma-70 [Paludibacter sp.]
MKQKVFRKNVLILRDKMLHIALRILNKEQDAEDVVQEVFLKLWMTKDALAGVENIEAYVTTMTKNACFDKIKLKKQNVDITNLVYQKARCLEKDIDTREAVNIIKVIIDELPDLQRLIITMHDMEDYTTKEVAKNIGSSIDAVRMNLSRARKRVRDIYQSYLNYENA